MIEGAHVGLRAIAREDLAQLLIWRNRPQLRRYFREARELNMTQQLQWFECVVLGGTDRIRMFSIQRLADSRLIGACGLTTLDWPRRSGELSLYIGHDDLYCDGVLAPDATRLLLTHGFEELGLNRIWAEVYAFDTAKQDMFAACGFREEGRLREHHWGAGRFWDAVLFGRLRGDAAGASHP